MGQVLRDIGCVDDDEGVSDAGTMITGAEDGWEDDGRRGVILVMVVVMDLKD